MQLSLYYSMFIWVQVFKFQFSFHLPLSGGLLQGWMLQWVKACKDERWTALLFQQRSHHLTEWIAKDWLCSHQEDWSHRRTRCLCVLLLKVLVRILFCPPAIISESSMSCFISLWDKLLNTEDSTLLCIIVICLCCFVPICFIYRVDNQSFQKLNLDLNFYHHAVPKILQ